MTRRWLPVLALVLLCVFFFWKLAFTEEYIWFDHPDMCFIEIPRLQMQAAEFHNGRFPLWDPFIWMGQPLIGQTQPGPLFPLNVLFGLLPLEDGYIQFRYLNWYWVAIHCIAALAAYALCRDLGRSRAASVLAGFAFAFGGFVGTVAWLDVINGAIWTPLIALFFLRAARGKRPWTNAIFCGAILGLAWLSGHHEVPMMVSYALGGGWLWTLWKRGRRAGAPAAVTFVVAGLIAAVQLWPTFEFARLSERWIGMERSYKFNDKIPYVAPTTYSMPVHGLLGVALNDSASYGDSAPYMGIAVTALAVIALGARWRSRPVQWFAAVALAGAIFALGALTPVHGWLFSFAPMLGKARVPVRAIHLLNFGVAILAAYGIDCLRRRGAWPIIVKRAVLVTGALIFAAAIWRRDVPDTLLWGAFAAIAVSIALHVRPRAIAIIFLAIAAFEVYPVLDAKFASRHSKEGWRFASTLIDYRDVAAFLRAQPAPRRVTVNDSDVATNFGDWYGVDMMEGYLAGVTSNWMRFGRHTRGAQDLLGITHHVGRTPGHPQHQEVFTGASGVKVFRNPTALPRAWSVHRAEQVSVPVLAQRVGDDPSFDPRVIALTLDQPPALETCEGDTVEVVTYAPNRVRIRASMKCRGLVNLSDTYYPGWKVLIDRKPAQMIETYGTIRGVVADGGEHEIEFAYKPDSVYGGAALTGSGLLVALAAAIVHLLRRR